MIARKLENRNQAASEVPFLPNKDDRYSESEIQQKLSAILSSLLGTDISEIRPSSAFSSYGVDSIIGVEFINALNDEFSLRLRTLIIFEYSNITSLSRFLYEKLMKTNVQESAAAVENEIYVDPQPILGHTLFTESLEDQRADSLKLKTEAVADILINQLAVSLGTEPSSIDRLKTFSEYGVDSIVGVELINLINETFQLSMKTITIFDYSNVNALAQYIAAKVGEIKKGLERTNREDYVLNLLDKLESNELSLVEISNLLGGSSR
ncbi:hypothetical protein AMQ83_26040 [Paenibacillus riograndensis]|nr:hypothetical protein AMQ83_26040 [Paenibacillus riograndensis]